MKMLKFFFFRNIMKLPFGEKIIIIINVLINDWRILPPGQISLEFVQSFSFEDIKRVDSVYVDLDYDSKMILKNYLILFSFPIPHEFHSFFFYNYTKFMISNRNRKKEISKIKCLKKKFFLSNFQVGFESLVHHHGLKEMSGPVKKYMQGKDFIDAGAFCGDSTLVFLEYRPAKIYAFEPSPSNRKYFHETMMKNQVSANIYELIPMGLSSQEDIILFHDTHNGSNTLKENGDTEVLLTTLDSFVKKHSLRTGVIKADLEGMCLEMVKGAEETIKKDRPVLTLAIYHNSEELFGVYQLLQSWNINYHFHIRCLNHPISEITLIGVPNEVWNQ